MSLAERNAVTNQILSDAQGRIMGKIVLPETKYANPLYGVFKLQFARGEFGMVIFNPETASCKIYEIKHMITIKQLLIYLFMLSFITLSPP